MPSETPAERALRTQAQAAAALTRQQTARVTSRLRQAGQPSRPTTARAPHLFLSHLRRTEGNGTIISYFRCPETGQTRTDRIFPGGVRVSYDSHSMIVTVIRPGSPNSIAQATHIQLNDVTTQWRNWLDRWLGMAPVVEVLEADDDTPPPAEHNESEIKPILSLPTATAETTVPKRSIVIRK